MKRAPWSRFAVGTPRTRRGLADPDCAPLVSVGHVAHVRAAFRIVEDGKLRPDLVFDESKLNTERIRVVWLSPNNWTNAGGFRYGNVRFSFDWEGLVRGKRVYWVESIAYRVAACRLLISDTNYDGALQLYDPRAERGPWWVSPSGKHYWNSKYCLEVMYDGDVPLERATGVDFVDHHPQYCNIDYRTCRDKGRSAMDAAGEFMATLASNNQRLALPGLVTETEGVRRPASALIQAHSRLYLKCGRLKPAKWGALRADDVRAPAIARALLRSLAARELADDAVALASVFQNAEVAGRAISDLLARAVDLEDGEVLLQW